MATEKTSVELFHTEHAAPPASSSPDPGDWTAEEERAVRRQFDFKVLPMVTVLYLLCFLDRANIGNARIQGMKDDLHLVGYRFNWALTVFYIVYMLVEVPSNIILKRVGPRLWIPILVVGFGFVSMCTAFVKTFAELCVARAFLGFFEGGTMPGLAFFLSCFYKREELLFRVGIFVSASSMAGAFGGLFATALSRIPRWGVASTPIHHWRNIFFFEGLLTIIAAAIAPFLMPDGPASCKFLSERQRYIATERLYREHAENPAENVKASDVKQAMLNINNIIASLAFFLINITVQSVSLFMPTILNDLGWTNTKAQLYSVPPYVVACLISIAVAFVSDKTRLRGVYLAFFSLISITGFAVLREVRDANIKYMAVFFAVIGAFPGGPGFLSWALNNAGGPAARAVSSGYIVSIGTLGAVVATWTYVPKDAPLYLTGHTINLGAEAAVFVLAVAGIVYCWHENRSKQLGKRNHLLETGNAAELGHKHPDFRYIL